MVWFSHSIDGIMIIITKCHFLREILLWDTRENISLSRHVLGCTTINEPSVLSRCYKSWEGRDQDMVFDLLSYHLCGWLFIFDYMGMEPLMFSLVFFSSGWTKLRNVSHLVTMIALYRWVVPFLSLSFLLKSPWMRFFMIEFVWPLRLFMSLLLEVGFLPSSFGVR